MTQGGIYIFSLLENYAAGLSLLTTVCLEAVAVSWVYGLKNFSDDVFSMLGHRPGLYWRITWKFVSPAFLAVRINSVMSSQVSICRGFGVLITEKSGNTHLFT